MKRHNNLNTTATDHCLTGINQFVRLHADAMQSIDASINADSDYCLPLIVKAWMLHGAGDDTYSDEVSRLISQAQILLPEQRGRESDLTEALSLASKGHSIESTTLLENRLKNSPKDLLIHWLVQEEIFWLGKPEWMREIIERASPHWNEATEGYGSYMSLRAFASEEAGYFSDAEKYGRAAVEIDPSDIWGTHAVAHVLLMRGEIHQGIDWLEGLSDNWGHGNQMKHHLWWHQCLFLLELGHYDRILHLLDSEVRNISSPLVQASPAATIDITNYASLLMRLELYGVDVASHWHSLATVCAGRVTNHASVFSNIHDMMVLSASGQTEDAQELLTSMVEHHADPSNSGLLAQAYRDVGIPVCTAIIAHRAKDYSQVLKVLGSVRHKLHLMGASHAQRDVFYHLLVHAATQEQRDDLRQSYLADIEKLGFCDVPNRAAYQANES